jgi:predicted DsbA family dithiol-disulfide isomerase
MDYLASNYGPNAAREFAKPGGRLDQLANAGRNVGINFTKSRKVVPTMGGHRLMEWCNINHPEKGNDLMEVLFSKYFEENEDVSQKAILMDAAKEVGLDLVLVEQFLDSSEKKAEVEQKDEYAKRTLRVSGVPYFMFGSKTGKPLQTFSGAQVQ